MPVTYSFVSINRRNMDTVEHQIAALRLAQDKQRADQEELRAAYDVLRGQIQALKARDDLGRLLSPTSIREVMDALRTSGRYQSVPISRMSDFGWAPAESHIVLVDDSDTGTAGTQVSGLSPSAREEPSVTAWKARTSDAARGGEPEPCRFSTRTPPAAPRVLPAAWRSAFADADAAVAPQAGREGQRSDTSRAMRRVGAGAHPEQLLFRSLPRASKTGSSLLAEAADLQPWFTRVLPQVSTVLWNVNWVDGHKLNTIGRRKPHAVHYAHRAGDGDGAVRSEFNIAYVGDWKSQKATGSGDMTEDELVHMIDFLMELARVQPWRRRFVGYLLDGIYIVFLSATFEPAQGAPVLASVLQSVPLRLQGDGGLFLHGLFLADLSATGCDLPRATVLAPPLATAATEGESAAWRALAGPVALLDVLGVGSTAVVFRARVAGADCAVKCLQGAGGLAAHELRILRHLRSSGVTTGIAGVAYEALEPNVIITSPVGERLAIRAGDVSAALTVHRAHVFALSSGPEFRGSCSGRPGSALWHRQQLRESNTPILINACIFEGVVDSLHHAHCCGIMHGDPRLANLAAVPLPITRSGSAAPYTRDGLQAAASAATDAACEPLSPPDAGGRTPHAQAAFGGLVLDFGYGHIGMQGAVVGPPAGVFLAESDGFAAWAAAYAFRYDAIGARPRITWVSLPYASRRQLVAYATGKTHCPEPSDDLFVLCASLYRLLVPWAPAGDVQTPEDALMLAGYWSCLVDGVGSGESGEKRRGLWGQAFFLAEAYDVRGFKAAVAGAVQSTVPDWPWGG